MHIPSGMGRPGHLGIKDPKTLYSVGALPERKRPEYENARSFHGCAGAPSLHVRACKAGGKLTLRTYQVAWGGGATLASRIQKQYILHVYSVGALPERQRPG